MNKMATGIATTGVVFAFGSGFDSETREAIRNAIEANDYNAWKEAMMETLTEERFNRMAERHQNRQAIMQALENGDYEAWKAAMENMGKDPGILDKITEENFNIFVQLHEARMNGDYETVQELSEELGLGAGTCGGRMFGRMGGMRHIPLEVE
jgi:YesN/AraC family two-component response regulator